MKTLKINYRGEIITIIVRAANYSKDNSLALVVTELLDDGQEDSFGTITVNMGSTLQDEHTAFVKTWSENESWALDLARQIGGVDTGIRCNNGYVEAPLYRFPEI